jgi:hypothetical protein
MVQAEDCFYLGGEIHSIGGQDPWPASAGRPDGVVRSVPEGHLVQWCPTVRGGAGTSPADTLPALPTLETVLAYGHSAQQGTGRLLPDVVYALAAI